jgi:hypothetical protein
MVRVYGFTLAELLLGFNLYTWFYNIGVVYLATLEE